MLLEDDLDQPRNDSSRSLVPRLKDEITAAQTALATLDFRIIETEGRIAKDRDRAAREQEAARREAQIATARERAAEFTAAAEALVSSLQSLIPLNLVTGAIASNTKFYSGQIAVGVTAALAECSNYCLRVGAGTTPIIGAPQPVAIAPPPPPAVARQLIYLLVDATWPETDGTMRRAGQFGQASPPLDIAKRAVALNLADWFNSPRAVKLRELYGCPFTIPHASTCTNLLTGERPKPESDDGSSAALAEWIGPPRTIEIAVS
jgi:hypothetical protein